MKPIERLKKFLSRFVAPESVTVSLVADKPGFYEIWIDTKDCQISDVLFCLAKFERFADCRWQLAGFLDYRFAGAAGDELVVKRILDIYAAVENGQVVDVDINEFCDWIKNVDDALADLMLVVYKSEHTSKTIAEDCDTIAQIILVDGCYWRFICANETLLVELNEVITREFPVAEFLPK